jgi:hypothetical protein
MSGRLRFTISDNSGRASVLVEVFRKTKRLRKWGPAILDSGAYYVDWRAPATPQRLRFCVLAHDTAGNESRESCAAVVVK